MPEYALPSPLPSQRSTAAACARLSREARPGRPPQKSNAPAPAAGLADSAALTDCGVAEEPARRRGRPCPRRAGSADAAGEFAAGRIRRSRWRAARRPLRILSGQRRALLPATVCGPRPAPLPRLYTALPVSYLAPCCILLALYCRLFTPPLSITASLTHAASSPPLRRAGHIAPPPRVPHSLSPRPQLISADSSTSVAPTGP